MDKNELVQQVNNLVEELYLLAKKLDGVGETMSVPVLLHQAININSDEETLGRIVSMLEETRERWETMLTERQS